MCPHFLSPFPHVAVFLPAKKVEKEQRHMVFLLRLTPTCEGSVRIRATEIRLCDIHFVGWFLESLPQTMRVLLCSTHYIFGIFRIFWRPRYKKAGEFRRPWVWLITSRCRLNSELHMVAHAWSLSYSAGVR